MWKLLADIAARVIEAIVNAPAKPPPARKGGEFDPIKIVPPQKCAQDPHEPKAKKR